MNELYLIAIAILLIVVIAQFITNHSAAKNIKRLTKRLNKTLELEKEVSTLKAENEKLRTNNPISNAKAEAEAIIANARRKAEVLKKEAKNEARKEAEEYREKLHTTTANKEKFYKEYKNRINFAVKGTAYRESEEIYAATMLRAGDFLFLEWEPDNEYDDYAMRVMTPSGILIGYVERQYSKLFYDKNVPMAEITKITNDDIPFIYANAMW